MAKKQHPAAEGIMALAHQGVTQARAGKDTTRNTRDFTAALRDSGLPEAAALANLIEGR